MGRPLAIFAFSLSIAFPQSAAAQRQELLGAEVRRFVAVDTSLVALVNVRVLDGAGGPPRENQVVVIRDSTIIAVGPRDRVRIPGEARVLDLAGHTVIPGIIGMHEHLGFGWDLDVRQDIRLYLAGGVTSLRTTGTYEPYREINLKRDIEAGRYPGPRVHLTAPYLTGIGPQQRMAQVATPDDARRFVDYWAAEGMEWIKVYTRIHRRELAGVIEQAHARGLRVTGHLCSVTAFEAAELGIDNIEHHPASTDFDPTKQQDECPQGNYPVRDQDMTGAIVQLALKHVALTATLPEAESYEPQRRAADPRVFEFMSSATALAYERQHASFDTLAAGNLARLQHAFRAFVDAGGLLAAGTDPVFPGLLPGFADQRNYELLIEAGFSPAQAVQIMSANGARLLGVDATVGTLAPGKLADLVVLRGNLVADPTAIRRVALVFKNGVAYDPAKLLESVREELHRDQ